MKTLVWENLPRMNSLNNAQRTKHAFIVSFGVFKSGNRKKNSWWNILSRNCTCFINLAAGEKSISMHLYSSPRAYLDYRIWDSLFSLLNDLGELAVPSAKCHLSLAGPVEMLYLRMRIQQDMAVFIHHRLSILILFRLYCYHSNQTLNNGSSKGPMK